MKDKISLREHIEVLFLEKEKQLELHFKLLDQALELSKELLEKRFSLLNDLRSSVEKDRVLYLTRIEYEAKHELILSKIDLLIKILNEKAPQAELDKITKLVYTGVGIAVTISFLVMLLEIILKFLIK